MDSHYRSVFAVSNQRTACCLASGGINGDYQRYYNIIARANLLEIRAENISQGVSHSPCHQHLQWTGNNILLFQLSGIRHSADNASVFFAANFGLFRLRVFSQRTPALEETDRFHNNFNIHSHHPNYDASITLNYETAFLRHSEGVYDRRIYYFI